MKYIKWIGISLVIILLSMVACTKVLSKKIPTTFAGDGDAVAQKMLTALNKPAWDSLNYLQWTFMNSHHYAWDKQANIANIRWKKNEVILDLDQLSGIAYVGGVKVSDADKTQKLVSKAWNFWCNDSFWMFAPYKVMDPGTTREIVSIDQEPDKTGLKVTYNGGGVTPGDVYIWALDENYMPTGYYMYVEILPVKGVYTSWKSWKDIGGAKLAIIHENKMFDMEMKSVKGGSDISSLDISPDRLTMIK